MKKNRDRYPFYGGWLKCIMTMKQSFISLLVSGVIFVFADFIKSEKFLLEFENELL